METWNIFIMLTDNIGHPIRVISLVKITLLIYSWCVAMLNKMLIHGIIFFICVCINFFFFFNTMVIVNWSTWTWLEKTYVCRSCVNWYSGRHLLYTCIILVHSIRNVAMCTSVCLLNMFYLFQYMTCIFKSSSVFDGHVTYLHFTEIFQIFFFFLCCAFVLYSGCF